MRSLVDETALIEALEAGQLHSAGLDVFANEPALNPRLLRQKNVFLTPHVASATHETRSAMSHRALDKIEAVLAGRTARRRGGLTGPTHLLTNTLDAQSAWPVSPSR